MEQLRVHVRNLSMLGINGATDSKGRVELYERGYGKDAAGIAKEAIAYGLLARLLSASIALTAPHRPGQRLRRCAHRHSGPHAG